MTQNTPYWLQVAWRVPREMSDFFTAEVSLLGLLGSEEGLSLDPAIEAAKTTAEILTFFADPQNPEDFKNQLKNLEKEGIKLVSMERIPQGNWATEWKKYFKPFSLTAEIVICPSWEKYDAKPHEKIIILDPGMAFGTGQHDTTRFCAELIMKVRHDFSGSASFLDIGCGSGILSIIAAKAGYAPILGIDNDPIAIETALENRDRNFTHHEIEAGASFVPAFVTTSGELKNLPGAPFDVIVANIFAETVCELKDDMLKLLKPAGRLILSGVIRDSDKLIRKNFTDMILEHYLSSEDWHAYVYRRQ